MKVKKGNTNNKKKKEATSSVHSYSSDFTSPIVKTAWTFTKILKCIFFSSYQYAKGLQLILIFVLFSNI